MNPLELLGFGPIIDFEKEDEGMEKEEMIERLTAFKNGWENPKSATPDFWEEVIKALPPVEQKQGKWIWIRDTITNLYHCSCCRAVVRQEPKNKDNYCRWCGAKMEGAE